MSGPIQLPVLDGNQPSEAEIGSGRDKNPACFFSRGAYRSFFFMKREQASKRNKPISIREGKGLLEKRAIFQVRISPKRKGKQTCFPCETKPIWLLTEENKRSKRRKLDFEKAARFLGLISGSPQKGSAPGCNSGGAEVLERSIYNQR
jgi:hypothetical protein